MADGRDVQELMYRQMKEKFALKMALEEQVHKNIMAEIAAAAGAKVKMPRARDLE